MPPVASGDTVKVHEDGHSLPAVIVAVTGETVTLDANHRMAGKDLVFDLHLVAICGGPSNPGHGHGCGSCDCGHAH